MPKTIGSKTGRKSLNDAAPARSGKRGAKTLKGGPESGVAGGKGDRDGKGDIQAKKANTSSSKKSASK